MSYVWCVWHVVGLVEQQATPTVGHAAAIVVVILSLTLPYNRATKGHPVVLRTLVPPLSRPEPRAHARVGPPVSKALRAPWVPLYATRHARGFAALSPYANPPPLTLTLTRP